MGIVGYLAWYLLSFLFTVGFYYALAIGFAVVLGSFFVYYDVVNGLSDTNALLVVVLLWDRFFGPYSKALRKVAKYINKAEQATTTSDNNYEFDNQH